MRTEIRITHFVKQNLPMIPSPAQKTSSVGLMVKPGIPDSCYI